MSMPWSLTSLPVVFHFIVALTFTSGCRLFFIHRGLNVHSIRLRRAHEFLVFSSFHYRCVVTFAWSWLYTFKYDLYVYVFFLTIVSSDLVKIFYANTLVWFYALFHDKKLKKRELLDKILWCMSYVYFCTRQCTFTTGLLLSYETNFAKNRGD